MDRAEKSLDLLKMDLVEVRAMVAYVESCVGKVVTRVHSDGPEAFTSDLQEVAGLLAAAQGRLASAQERLRARGDAGDESKA